MFDGFRHGAKKPGNGPDGFDDACTQLGLKQVVTTWHEAGCPVYVEIHYSGMNRTRQCAETLADAHYQEHSAHPTIIESPELGYEWVDDLGLPKADHHATRDHLIAEHCNGDINNLTVGHWLVHSGIGDMVAYAASGRAWMQITARRLAADHPDGANVAWVGHSPCIGLVAPDTNIKTLSTAAMLRFPVKVDDGTATITQPTRHDCPLGGGAD